MRCAALSLFLLPFLHTWAAAARLEVQVEPRRLPAGEAALLRVTLHGTQSAPLPEFQVPPSIQVQYLGPSTQVMIVNGQVQARVEHRYQVHSDTPGRYQLGPFSVQLGSEHLEASAVEVEVLPPSAGNAARERPLRLVVRAAKARPYVRERIPIEVLLYVGAVRVGDLQYPQLNVEGAALDRFGEPTQGEETVDGQRFQVVRFASTLTPLKPGLLALGPATLSLSVLERPGRSWFDDPFFWQRRNLTLHAEAVPLEVQPLPERGRPPDFSGAVGRFTLHAEAQPTEVRTGDPVTFRFTLRGDGNLDGVIPPSLRPHPAWKFYDPQLVQSGPPQWVFEQVAIPKTPAEPLPPLSFSYFDPELERYQTIESGPLAVVVRPSLETPAAVTVAEEPGARDQADQDILDIKEDPGHLRLPAPTGGSVAASNALVLCFPLAAYLWDRHRRRRQADREWHRIQACRAAARAGIARCEAALSEPRAFYDALAETLRAALSARFDLAPGFLDAERATLLPLPENARARTRALLEACEAVRFGLASPRVAPAQHLEELRALLDLLDRPQSGCSGAPRTAAAILLLLAATSTIADVTLLARFAEGNAAYRRGDYTKAAEAYESVLRAGYESAAIYYNIGNALVRAGDLGRAIWSYERARLLDPRDPDLAANLAFARARAGARACPDAWWERLLLPFATRLSRGELAGLTQGFYLLTAALATMAFLLPSWRRLLLRGSAASLGLVVLAGASWLLVRLRSDPASTVVVLSREPAAVRYAPEPSATVHYAAPPGTLLRLQTERGSWVLVAACDGRRGWLERQYLAKLADSVPPAITACR